MKKFLYTAARLLQFVLVYTVFGAACGSIAGVFSFSLWWNHNWRFAVYLSWPMGAATGFLLAPLAFILLRRFPILPTGLKLVLGTCAGSFLGSISPLTAWGLGIMGFAFASLLVWARAPDMFGNDPQPPSGVGETSGASSHS